ncbi:MAG: TfoX/Sxy family protein [Candidatus Tectomicrobia bacterium]|uniref:TfoX/Sxy family protein n=1 Tax=Tectimicrobiota bacterium TaxID=2528274 RepID=A0A932HY13_UNCTE|nr:TfoX/Sxy family protein [Candidatus Tectomicrobia bacterium]
MVREPDSFQEFVEDQLAGLGRVEVRRMFGGAGVYKDGVFFGALHKERLYFKTDEASRAEYLSRGMGPFRPTPKQIIKTYYEVPVEIVEDADALVEWAKRALACREAEQKPRPRKTPAKGKEKPKTRPKAKGSRARGR